MKPHKENDFFTAKARVEIAKGKMGLSDTILLLQTESAKRGFDFANPREVVAKVIEEADEVKEAFEKDVDFDHLLEEIGDLFFAIFNLSRHLNVAPLWLISYTIEKYLVRCEHIESRLAEMGKNWSDLSKDEIGGLWAEAKKIKPPHKPAT